MPCYSSISTVFLTLTEIEEAAKNLGLQVEKHTPNMYTVKNGRGAYMVLSRAREGAEFESIKYSYDFESEIATPLVKEYAKIKTKAYYKSKGYTMSQGKKADQYILTSFK